jgi:hypothetical protein
MSFISQIEQKDCISNINQTLHWAVVIGVKEKWEELPDYLSECNGFYDVRISASVNSSNYNTHIFRLVGKKYDRKDAPEIEIVHYEVSFDKEANPEIAALNIANYESFKEAYIDQIVYSMVKYLKEV